MSKSVRGFTLIELLVVIAIIGILSAVVLASLGAARARARDAQRQQDIRNVNTALQMYFADHGSYPSTGNLNNVYMDPGCEPPTSSVMDSTDAITADWVPGLVAGGYIAQLPRDPQGMRVFGGTTAQGVACYVYTSNGTDYILSAWATVETGPIPETHALYSRAGIRETVHNPNYQCNHGTINGAGFYSNSYTISNTACTW